MTYPVPIGPLTAVAMADAFARGFEFGLPLPYEMLKGMTGYRAHSMWPFLPPGSYSDDTQMTLALAELLLLHPGSLPSADEIENKLVAAYAHDPRGYSTRMREAFGKAVESGEPLSDILGNAKGDSAGAAMRASVSGVLGDVRHVMHFAKVQAEITHAGDGVLAAQMAAMMAFLTCVGCERSAVRAKLLSHWPDARLREPLKGRPLNKGMACVVTALNCLENAASLWDLLLRCVAVGGDTDTVAVIAMGAGWWCRDLPNDLPHWLWYGLEDGAYGRSHLRRTEIKLAPKYGFRLRVD